MTPLQSFLSRWLPGPLVSASMTLIYAVLLIGIVVCASRPVPDLIYIDTPERLR